MFNYYLNFMVSQEVLLKLIRNSKSKLTILKILGNEPHYVREISKKLNMFPSAMLKHLEFLEANKVVNSESVGKKKYFKLTKKGKDLLELL